MKKPTLLTIFFTALIVAAFILPNRFSGQSVNVGKLEEEKLALQKEIKSLEFETASLRSLDSISKRASLLGMCAAKEVWYIESSDSLASL